MLDPDNPVPRSLRVLHMVCFACHLASAIAVPIYMHGVPRLPFYKTVYTNATLTQSLVETGTMKAYSLLEVFFLASTAEHAFCFLFPMLYVQLVGTVAWQRWASYSISAPVMIVMVGYSCGIGDSFALVAMAGLIFGMIGTGALFDMARGKQDMGGMVGALVVGFVLLLFAFIPIWAGFAGYTEAPAFVYAIVVLITLLYFSFGFVPIGSLLVGEERPYLRSEYAYCVLSLTSKLLLGHLFGTGFAARFG